MLFSVSFELCSYSCFLLSKAVYYKICFGEKKCVQLMFFFSVKEMEFIITRRSNKVKCHSTAVQVIEQNTLFRFAFNDCFNFFP